MPNTLQEAVAEYLATLSSVEMVELGSLIPNLREPMARKWMDSVIDIFGLVTLDSDLVNDIRRRFPNEAVFIGTVFDNVNGLFEAEIILREARRAILAGHEKC